MKSKHSKQLALAVEPEKKLPEEVFTTTVTRKTSPSPVHFQIIPEPIFVKEIPCHAFRKTWVKSCEDEHTIVSDERSIGTFNLITYNIWGAPQDEAHACFNFAQRSKAIVDILLKNEGDIICLQEVSQKWAHYLLNHPSIQAAYFSSDASGKRIHSSFGLGQMIFSKYPMSNITVYGLPGYMLSTLLSADIHIDDNLILINNVHLHSGKEYEAFRIAQLKTINEIIERRLSIRDYQDSIIAGDFNFSDGWPECDYLDLNAYHDAWKTHFPEEKGYTEDTDINRMRFLVKQKRKQVRFDRVLHTGSTYKSSDIQLLGTKAVTKDGATWPSDHFGLLTQFQASKVTASKLEKGVTETKEEAIAKTAATPDKDHPKTKSMLCCTIL